MSTISAYTGDGSTTQFDITFTYRDASTVKASLDGVETEDFTFVNPSRIAFDLAPDTGVEVKIFRQTAISPPEVEFADGAIIRGDDLNDAIAQPRDRVEELTSELDDISGRAVKVASGFTGFTVPGDEERAGKYLAFGPDGGAVMSSGTGTDAGLRTDLADPDGPALLGFRHNSDDAVNSTVAEELRRWVFAEHFGLSPDNTPAENSAAILAAVEHLRSNPTVLSTNGLGSGSFTAYSSGLLRIGEGEFPIAPDVLEFTQDLGLIIQGAGSRRTNNAIKARTTLLITGDGEFGIRTYANGARGLTLEDLDLNYDGDAFTGDVLDIYSTPGVTVNRVHLGTNGTSAATRKQTARSLIRSTYDEFLHVRDSVLDGAVDGWWSDDTREPSSGFSDFGGANSLFVNTVVYDVTGSGFRHDGNRTRSGHTHINGGINPISVNCTRGFKFDNIKGLSIIGAGHAGSTDKYATTEWMRVVNCVGTIRGCYFNDFSKAGTLGGALEVSGNYVYSTDGFTIVSGPFTGFANNFTKGTTGYTVSPAAQCAFRLGPDTFMAGVTRSYDIPADNASLAGRIVYDASSDGSTSQFRNTSGRVTIEALDGKYYAVSAASATLSILNTGRTAYANGSSAQVFTLPVPVAGAKMAVTKVSGVDLTINCSAGTSFYGQGTGLATSAALTGTAQGTILLDANATVGWIVRGMVNTWTFS